jgi:hypothetical protein
MTFSTPARLGVAALALLSLTSCAATSQLTTSWADPAAAGRGFKKVVIVGASPNSAVRRMYEDTFASELRSRGIEAIPSYTVVGEGQLNKDDASAKLKEVGADGVIVTRLVDKETVENYYPPTYSTYAAPSAYYGGWYGYYNMGYSYMSTPGYVEQNHVYRVETNLYDVANDKLAWSGLTESTLSSGQAPTSEIQPVITMIANDMEKKKIIGAKAKK